MTGQFRKCLENIEHTHRDFIDNENRGMESLEEIFKKCEVKKGFQTLTSCSINNGRNIASNRQNGTESEKKGTGYEKVQESVIEQINPICSSDNNINSQKEPDEINQNQMSNQADVSTGKEKEVIIPDIDIARTKIGAMPDETEITENISKTMTDEKYEKSKQRTLSLSNTKFASTEEFGQCVIEYIHKGTKENKTEENIMRREEMKAPNTIKENTGQSYPKESNGNHRQNSNSSNQKPILPKNIGPKTNETVEAEDNIDEVNSVKGFEAPEFENIKKHINISKSRSLDIKHRQMTAGGEKECSPKLPQKGIIVNQCEKPSLESDQEYIQPKYLNVINTSFIPSPVTSPLLGTKTDHKAKKVKDSDDSGAESVNAKEKIKTDEKSRFLLADFGMDQNIPLERRKSLNEIEAYPKYQKIRKSKSVDLTPCSAKCTLLQKTGPDKKHFAGSLFRKIKQKFKCTKSYPEIQRDLCPRINVVIEEPSLSDSCESFTSGVDFSLSDNADDLDDQLEEEFSEDFEKAGFKSKLLGKFHSLNVRRGSKDHKYEEAMITRRRSKSFDNANLGSKSFDFARYGISIGAQIPQDLLPGIEDFLSNVLAKEALSPYAEEQRQYFLERLDIIKLPPSIPPRPQTLAVRVNPTTSTPPPSNRHSFEGSIEPEDFAAYQRELSRALITDTTPEHVEVKLYDDIELTDDSVCIAAVTKQEEEEESLYEIPQIKRANLNDSGYEKAGDISILSKSLSCESLRVTTTLTLATPDTNITASYPDCDLKSRPLPPPLPPRKDRAFSDSATRGSVGNILDDRAPDLTTKGSSILRDTSTASIPAASTYNDKTDARSDKSTQDHVNDDIDGLSCDSLDDASSQSKDIVIKLPKPVKKKRSQRQRLGQSMSSLREITQPFRLLEDVCLSGELHYKSKLTWNRKLVALTNGRLICYKYDRADTRPTLVILLVGYRATYSHREGKKSYDYEILLAHDNFESHFFLVEFKEWAEMWCNYMNLVAEGKRAPGPYQHLSRTALIDNSSIIDPISKSNHQLSISNLSIASSDGFDSESGTSKVKKRDSSGVKTPRMGSLLVTRASQIFENFGKKSSVKKTLSGESDKFTKGSKLRPLSNAVSQTSLCEVPIPLTPESGIVDVPVDVKRHIKLQGYLNIYSSFNKRKWGKRWCIVQENKFECYRTQISNVVELEFPLRNCTLRRAVNETKSELGLMLMENNREKITIEPMNWSELGSWLRVLMKETATMVIPDGLQGYMDESNPYHEAEDITQLPDPFPTSPTSVSPINSADRTLTDISNNNPTYDKKRNRDSGNCSAESFDGRLDFPDRVPSSTSQQRTSPDANIIRTIAPNTSDIYAQVFKVKDKNSTKSATLKNDNKIPDQLSVDKHVRSKSDSDLENSMFLFDFDSSERRPDYRPQKSLMDEIMSQVDSQMKKAQLDAESESESSDDTHHEQFVSSSAQQKEELCSNSSQLSVPKDYSELLNTISPIKNPDEPGLVLNNNQGIKHFLSSSTLEDEGQNSDVPNHNQTPDKTSNRANIVNSTVNNNIHETPKTLHHSSSLIADNGEINNVSAKVEKILLVRSDPNQNRNQTLMKGNNGSSKKDSEEKVTDSEERLTVVIEHPIKGCCGQETETSNGLQELRKTLMQLKKERISIKERKDQASSEFDKEFLEAEHQRLERECKRVTDEITYLETTSPAIVQQALKLDCIPEDIDSDLGDPTPVDSSKDEEMLKQDENCAICDKPGDISIQKNDSTSKSVSSFNAVFNNKSRPIENKVSDGVSDNDEINVMIAFDKLIVELESEVGNSDESAETKDLSSIEEEGTDSESGSRHSSGKCACSVEGSVDRTGGCEICKENVSIKELIENISEERGVIQGDSAEFSVCGSEGNTVNVELTDESVERVNEVKRCS